jgi:hypothetical protein
MKKVAFILLLFFALAQFSHSQLAAGYNTDGNTLSLSLKPFNKIWGEFRVNTTSYNQASWTYNDAGITQAYLMFNIFPMTNANLYTGAGVGANLLSDETDKWLSINIPVGLSISPFTRFPDLFLTAEYNPMIIPAEGIPIIHTVSLGFRYRLIRGE